MDYVYYQPDFITDDEQSEIIQWFNDNLDTETFVCASSGSSVPGEAYTKARKTTRLQNDKNKVLFPLVLYRIFDRILQHFELGEDDFIRGQTGCKDGMIAVATYPNEGTHIHTDGEDCVTINLMVQAPQDGGIVLIEKAGHLQPASKSIHAYRPARYWHGVSPVWGHLPRYMVLFRIIPREGIEIL